MISGAWFPFVVVASAAMAETLRIGTIPLKISTCTRRKKKRAEVSTAWPTNCKSKRYGRSFAAFCQGKLVTPSTHHHRLLGDYRMLARNIEQFAMSGR
jgi:hypothetical protein